MNKILNVFAIIGLLVLTHSIASTKAKAGGRDIGNGEFVSMPMDVMLEQCILEGYEALEISLNAVLPETRNDFADHQERSFFMMREWEKFKSIDLVTEQITAQSLSQRALSDDGIREYYHIGSEIDGLVLSSIVEDAFNQVSCVMKNPLDIFHRE